MLVLGQKQKSRNGAPVSASAAQADMLVLVLLLVPKGLWIINRPYFKPSRQAIRCPS
jgi:hypothetical protein